MIYRTVLLVALILLTSGSQAGLPHVSECRFCMKCHVDGSTGASSAARRLTAWQSGPSPAGVGEHSLHGGISNWLQHAARSILQTEQSSNIGSPSSLYSRIFPTVEDIRAKELKPNCSECHGCDVELSPLKAVVAFGQDFKVERGASPEWIFTADLPASQGGGKAVVKVWCMPIDKVHGTFAWKCEKSDHAMQANQFLVAQDKVVGECGLLDVTIKAWIAPVNAVEPASGLHIWWHGLWMERAEGISLNQLSYVARKSFVTETTMNLLQTKLNRTRVVRAAMLDLLTSQCDRHAQNVFINENGQIKLIDNMQALRVSWLTCGSDSIFLPGTQKNEVVRFGGTLVGKALNAKPKRSINPMVLLDYRCYVPGGRIGSNYPPELEKCLRKFAAMDPTDIMQQYNFPFIRNAEALHNRSKDMLDKGFEWTLQRGEPVNLKPKRYRWHAPCCKLGLDSSHILKCGEVWNPKPEFPFGDPVRGTGWTRAYPDPGSFEGGSIFED